MMNQAQINQKLKGFTLPSYQEIPDVGLYLEQVTRYINRYLNGYPAMAVTGSMISNYVKLKIIPKVEKKAYSREQIADVFFIAMAKTVLSMDQIRSCFAMWKDQKTPEEFYNAFSALMKEALHEITSNRQEGKKSSDAFTSLLTSIAVTIAHKMYLDAFFSEKND